MQATCVIPTGLSDCTQSNYCSYLVCPTEVNKDTSFKKTPVLPFRAYPISTTTLPDPASAGESVYGAATPKMDVATLKFSLLMILVYSKVKTII